LQNRDALYEQAISVVVQEQRGSCSLLQRSLEIGYGRAARLIDFMAKDGYVGPYNGSKAREVLLSEEQWHNIQTGDPNPVNDEDWPEEEAVEESAPVAINPPKSKLKVANRTQPAAEVDDKLEEKAKPGSASKSKTKSTSSTQRKKLLRLEPGQETLRSANVSFAPKSKFKIKPQDELELEEELEDEELEEEEYEDYEEDDDEVEAVGDDDEYEYVYEDEDEEYDESDYEDADEYEDVEEEE